MRRHPHPPPPIPTHRHPHPPPPIPTHRHPRPPPPIPTHRYHRLPPRRHPNAPVDPNAPAPAPAPPQEPGRVDNAAGNFSYVVPPGWVVGDASKLNYGQALLSKETGPAVNGQPAPVANDTSVLLGRLDLKLFAGAEPDNAKAAVRLASDMGEFFMPYPGTRINQQTFPLDANGMTGSASSYEVKFTDTTKPNGQIWAGVVGNANVNAPRGQRNERWFVVWLGTAKNPIDTNAAVALANSIRPWSPPPPPEPVAPPRRIRMHLLRPWIRMHRFRPWIRMSATAPTRAPVGVPVPVTTPVPEMMPPA